MKPEPSTDTYLTLSLSEISALSARAIRGAERNWGEAEEAAEAACWLARSGLDWAGTLLEVLEAAADDPNCALRAGILLADTAILADTMAPQKRRVTSPCFLLPFVARIANQNGQRTLLEWDETAVVLAPGAAPIIANAVRIAGPADVTITPVTHDNAPCPDWPQTHRGAVTSAQYARLTQFMVAFTVPTSTGSLAGAGARGSDND